jgi:phage-related protein
MWTVETLGPVVDQEIEQLPEELRSHFTRTLQMIVARGLERSGMPHVKHVRGPIWEIRFSGRATIGRALYATVIGKRIVILRVFVKKTEKTPPRDIELAFQRFGSLQA